MKKKTLSPDDISSTPVQRRSAMRMLGAAAVGVAMTGCYRGIRSGCTDSDPVDRAGAGRRCGAVVVAGCSDSDPRDPAGAGVRCGRPVRACTDRDPYDGVGRGRRC